MYRFENKYYRYTRLRNKVQNNPNKWQFLFYYAELS